MIKAQKKLPEKRSELIRLAVKDAVKVSQNPKFKLDMGRWVMGKEWDVKLDKMVPKKQCNVCMAGAVMVSTLNFDISEMGEEYEATPDRFDKDTKNKLYIINRWRAGDIDDDLENKYQHRPDIIAKIDEARLLIRGAFRTNLDNGRADWIIYFRAANILESVGL